MAMIKVGVSGRVSCAGSEFGVWKRMMGNERSSVDSRENKESDRVMGFLLRDFFFFFCVKKL